MEPEEIPEARKGVCVRCHSLDVIEEKTRLCPTCYVQKTRMRGKVLDRYDKFDKQLYSRRTPEEDRAGYSKCYRCQRNFRPWKLNNDDVCAKCQTKLNKHQFKEEAEFEKEGFRKRRRKGENTKW